MTKTKKNFRIDFFQLEMHIYCWAHVSLNRNSFVWIETGFAFFFTFYWYLILCRNSDWGWNASPESLYCGMKACNLFNVKNFRMKKEMKQLNLLQKCCLSTWAKKSKIRTRKKTACKWPKVRLQKDGTKIWGKRHFVFIMCVHNKPPISMHTHGAKGKFAKKDFFLFSHTAKIARSRPWKEESSMKKTALNDSGKKIWSLQCAWYNDASPAA